MANDLTVTSDWRASKVRLNMGGYDASGSYWGNDTLSLYYVSWVSGEGKNRSLHIRAPNRANALELAKEQYSKAYYDIF